MWSALALVLPALASDARSYLVKLGGESLRCSACELVADKVEEAIAAPSFAKGWKEWTTEQRVSKLKASLRKKCPKFQDMMIARTGSPPVYGDFQELMNKQSELTDLSMGITEKNDVHKLCLELTGVLDAAELVGAV